ncbi:MAG: hypothetical protein ABI675_19565 [Chitinophagaceae bacterium]
MDQHIQIDITKVHGDGNLVEGGMYTGGSWVRIAMSKNDYETLVREGFFIRDGKSKDSAGVINTTNTFYPEKKINDAKQTRRS